jgi:CarD family transcriptional regulator
VKKTPTDAMSPDSDDEAEAQMIEVVETVAAPPGDDDAAVAAAPDDDDDDDDDVDDAPEPAIPANDSTPVRAAAPMPPRHGGQMHGGQRPPGGGMQGRIMPAPRPMAKAEQFAEGDHVVYPTHGVGKVERIATEEIAGHKLELIHITFEENRMTLRVPVAKARSAGLRKLASRKMFDEALAVLKGRARIKRTMWSRRAQEYEAKINSGDPLAIAEVVRDLHRNAGQPDQSFSERQIYEAAMDRLAAELGALERIDKAAASIKLAEFLKTV